MAAKTPARELIRLAMVFAEQDRAAMAEATRGADRDTATRLAQEFRAYRLKHFGPTSFEVEMANAKPVDVYTLHARHTWKVGRVRRSNAGGNLYNAVRTDTGAECPLEPSHDADAIGRRVDNMNRVRRPAYGPEACGCPPGVYCGKCGE